MTFETQIWLAVGAFIAFDLLLLGYIFYRRRPRLTDGERDFVRRQWRLVGAGTQPKHDILEADKLLDFVLGRLGYTGSLGEKLQQAGPRFAGLDAVWAAHKLRNRLAHEIGFTPTATETRQALQSFARALRQLGVPLDD